MLRKLLIPMLVTVALAGCATDYRYNGGNGDYYYGSPQVEYRYLGPGGYYGGAYGAFGPYGPGYGGYGYGGYGYGATYYYDAFGRLVYGYPGRYGYGNTWYRVRPNRGHHGGTRDDGDVEVGESRQNAPPPWRNLGGLQQRNGVNERNDDDRGQRATEQRFLPNPISAPSRVRQRSVPVTPTASPMIRERSQFTPRLEGGSRGSGRARTRVVEGSDE